MTMLAKGAQTKRGRVFSCIPYLFSDKLDLFNTNTVIISSYTFMNIVHVI